MKRNSLFVFLTCLMGLSACLPLAPATDLSPTLTSTPIPTSTRTPTPTATLPPTPTATPPFDAARLGTVERDLTYCIMGGVAQKMDVYFPESGGPWPVLVYVHGGGWIEGDKYNVDGRMTPPGYLVVSINYRLYPTSLFPAMIQDVKCAIRSLRAHAADFNLDPNRIGLFGGSAGGHLVALAGTADESAGFDVGQQYLDQSSRVQAVVELAGPADLTRPYPDWLQSVILNVFGEDQLVSGSPVTYISPDDPPFLILHGDMDDVVPIEQSLLLYEQLTAAGIPAQMIIIHNADHGFNPAGGELSPGWEELSRIIADFWDQTLR